MKVECHPSHSKGLLLFTMTLPLWILILIIRPEDLIHGRFQINSEIRTANDPLDITYDGSFRSTEDGLHCYVSSVDPSTDILVIGESNTRWHRFPRYLEEESIRQGQRIRCLNASIEGVTSYETADHLAYILDHNGRNFEAALIKVGLDFPGNLYIAPEYAFTSPNIGSGAGLLYSGSPADATRCSYWDHYRSTLRRRQKDLYLQNRNRLKQEFWESAKPDPDVQFPTGIPQELLPQIDPLLDKYEDIVLRIVSTCREHGVRPILLSNARRDYSPEEEVTHQLKFLAQSFRGRDSVLTFDYLIFERMNRRLKEICQAEGIQFIDYAGHLKELVPPGQPTRTLFEDPSHLYPQYEIPLGQWVFLELKNGGL